jgi:hypothetical protein
MCTNNTQEFSYPFTLGLESTELAKLAFNMFTFIKFDKCDFIFSIPKDGEKMHNAYCTVTSILHFLSLNVHYFL